MGISGIDPRLSSVPLLQSVSSAARCASPVGTGRDGSGASSATTSISPAAQYLGQLVRLQQSNPGEFKTVLTDIADKLQAAADKAGGREGEALSNLASKFRAAGQTGDLSSLRPAHHHHGHHHPGAIGYQQASDQGLPTRSPGDGSPAGDVRSQVLDIVGQAISQDLGSAGTGH
jgi:hypothetical protein